MSGTVRKHPKLAFVECAYLIEIGFQEVDFKTRQV